MFKEIYRKKDGKPILIESIIDDDKEYFDYDTEDFVEEEPQNDLYDPIYYSDEDKEWKGTPYQEWLKSLNDEQSIEIEEEIDPESERDKEIAMITKLLFNSQKEMEDLQQDVADLVKHLTNKEE